MSNTSRIVKNTLILYFRQILIMLVSLYTVRVVLETLGAEDYGIYNVVAGGVTMFGVLSNAMAIASQRYFSFAIGQQDYLQLEKFFSLNFIIYMLIIIFGFILAETMGVWFINKKLIILSDRIMTVKLLYQFSVVSFLFSIIVTPFLAIIISHEDMHIYASLSILETVLKLGIVFLLPFISIDKLQLYGLLICIVTIINAVMYIIICKIRYHECTFKLYWNKDIFIEIAGYTGWNLFGAFSGVFKIQMITILLNQFFNPTVVIARSIALSVNNAVSSFSGNFYNAVRPQIIKNYAMNKKEEMLSLVFYSTKIIYFLMFVFILPLMLELPIVFSLWLKNPPPNVVLFTRLTLFEMLINAVTMPFGSIVHATGKIKIYQSVYYGVLLLNLPLSWIILSQGAQAYSVMIISIFLTFIDLILVIFIVKSLIKFPVKRFIKDVILSIAMMSLFSTIFPIVISRILSQSFIRLCIVAVVSILSTGVCMYFFGLNKLEQKKIRQLIYNKIHLSRSKI